MAFDLRNPHSVLAAIAERPADVLEVRIHSGRAVDAWADVVQHARSAGIAVRLNASDDSGRRRQQRRSTERSGAGSARVKEPRQTDPGEFLPKDRHVSGGLWLALDCVQDPQNVGSIFRSAAFFGIKGVIVSKDRSAPINATVCDVACGGVETVPFQVVSNLRRALQTAKDRGLWILGTTEHAEQDVYAVDRGRPWLLVLGNEQHGMRRLTTETCDEVCRLTPRGGVTSLNVSVAAGALMGALVRDGGSGQPPRP